jgi:UPF0755 protein
MSRYTRTGKKSLLPKALIIIAVLVICAGVGTVLYVRRSYTNNLKPVSASQKNQLVTIPLGSSVKEIGVILEEAGVIRAGWAFEWYVRNNDLRDSIQAGSYYFRPNQSVEEITSVLTQGKVATDLITILPAQRIDQIRKALINAGYSETAVDTALEPSQYENHPALVDKPKGASLEGYIFPESFQKTAETSPEVIIRASLDEMQKSLTPALRASIVRQGLTVHEGVILASIIEQEVSNPDDKKTVAQVFLRRLREGRALESDPTASYGAILDGQTPSLTYDSLYNTYKNKGLPPTPISNVSRLSLEAVGNPASTNYLFFVAGDDGKTYFSSTLEEHEALTQQHCKKLCGNE